jgi:branched-chain amino acid transport system ATP-binding protein
LGTKALELSGINTFYGASHILRDLSLAVDEGEFVALLGRNGVGKSTCMSSIIGLNPPRSGEVAIFGEKVSRLPPEQIAGKGVGYVPQGRRVFPSLSVRENLTVAARSSSGHATWDVGSVFEEFPRLKERQNVLAGKISGGEQQMLAIGRALMVNPKLLLLDEPSEGLSPQMVSNLKQFILSLRQRKISVLLVEQNVNLALDVAERVILMNTAGVCFTGSTEELRGNSRLLNKELGVA